MMRISLALGPVLLMTAAGALAGDRAPRSFRVEAILQPTEEVPALSSTASGSFKAWIDEANQTISYRLQYDGLEGTTLQAHIHVGQRGVNGGVSVFLFGNPPTVPPAPVPTPPVCPEGSATIEGVLTPANIVGPNAQGIAPTSDGTNEFAELIAVLRSGVTYANVHTSKFPGGEIRGQLRDHKR